MNDSFAPPVSQLASPTVGGLQVAAYPTGGQGLALDHDGSVPDPVRRTVQGWQLDRQTITADTTTVSVVDVDLVTFGLCSFDGGLYYAEVSIPNLRNSGAGNSTFFTLKVGATASGGSVQVDAQSAGNGWPAAWRFPLQPSPGQYVYKWTWHVSAGTATIRTTGLAPAEFRIVKA